MDVIYPLSNMSKAGDDFELRMSLRSLEQQDWVENVFLIGHKPKWVNHEIFHIHCLDPYSKSKDANIINKILLACHHCISPVFVVNSDDQIFLKKVEPSDMFPRKIDLSQVDHMKMVGSSGNNWYRRLKDTQNFCTQKRLPSWIFQSHVPYLVSQADYPVAMSRIPWGHGNGFVTHIYYNLTLKNKPDKETTGRTIRIRSPLKLPAIKRLCRDVQFLNFNNSGLNFDMKRFLEQKFPGKSRWEQK